VEPESLDDARQTLAQIEARLRRDVADMVRVLEADIPAFVVRTVRRAFEQAPEADDLSDGALRALKEETAALGRDLAKEVGQALGAFEVWQWDSGWRMPPAPPEDLAAHPRVTETLGRIGGALSELIGRHGLPAGSLGEDPGYRLPAYFVAGHFMKSLVNSYWRALADHEELRGSIADADQADERKARAARWETA